jgi:hypothetical protein
VVLDGEMQQLIILEVEAEVLAVLVQMLVRMLLVAVVMAE